MGALHGKVYNGKQDSVHCQSQQLPCRFCMLKEYFSFIMYIKSCKEIARAQIHTQRHSRGDGTKCGLIHGHLCSVLRYWRLCGCYSWGTVEMQL